MGKYDNYDREYFTRPEHLAELISVGVYHEQISIESSNLQKLDRSYPSLASLSGTIERDGFVEDHSTKIRYGLEIETEKDYSMPRRFMTYDACDYEKQAKEIRTGYEAKGEWKNYQEKKSGMKIDDGYKPVINLLLYLGKGHFGKKDRLRELFQFQSNKRELVLSKTFDYGYHLIEIDYIDPNVFKTELHYFFLAIQCRKDREMLQRLVESEEFQNVTTETKQVIAIHLGMKKLIKTVVEEGKDMCEAMREWLKDERMEGKREGREEGRTVGRTEGENLVLECLAKIKQGMNKEDLLKAGYEEMIISRLVELQML